MVYYTLHQDIQGIPTTTASYSIDDFYAVIGGKNWTIGRRTGRIVALKGRGRDLPVATGVQKRPKARASAKNRRLRLI